MFQEHNLDHLLQQLGALNLQGKGLHFRSWIICYSKTLKLQGGGIGAKRGRKRSASSEPSYKYALVVEITRHVSG
jgi:hypothetical protein